MKNSTAVKEDAQRLLSDLRTLGLEAEKMIENSASDLTESAVKRLRQQLSSAQERLSDYYGVARDATIAGAKYTDHAIRENPYRSLAAGAAIGLLAGFLIGRSSSSD